MRIIKEIISYYTYMKINFNIDYHTNWGEELYIVSDIPELAGSNSEGVKMSYDSNGHWTLDVDIKPSQGCFEYRYVVRHANGDTRHEWGAPHIADIDPRATNVRIFDNWNDVPQSKASFSTAYLECINPHKSTGECVPSEPGYATFLVSAPCVPSNMVLAVCGSCEALGMWDPNHALVLDCIDFPKWRFTLPLKAVSSKVEYKYLLLKQNTREVVAWEPHPNRILNLTDISANDAVIIGYDKVGNPLPPYRGAGTAIPVFSLRSEHDFGVGEFLDLKLMVDWAKSTGQQFIQLLPINDTTMTHTWTDSYPYNANSTFALHPMYLRVEELGTLDNLTLAAELEEERRKLNELPQIDYERANNAKERYTRAIYGQIKDTLSSDHNFQNFVANNKEWLMPYAAWCVLRDQKGTSDIRQWGEYATYIPSKMAHFISANFDEIQYHCYIQYHLDKQMLEVRNYAHSNGVAIKGDIPIGISRDSVDAWLYPDLFNLNCSAGAPPDDFSVMGQNWGFPTYNWEEMSKDGFAWWKSRLRKMSEYFDAYRIDHVLGFFRIWQIPLDALHGLLGVFNPALPFSPDELRNNFGFYINPDLHTRPYIRHYMLADFFGEHTQEAINSFLDTHDNGVYTLKSAFDTQRKVADYFAGQEANDKNNRLCNALMGLIDDVLFIEDPYEKGKYHPRISAQFTYIYRSLSDYDKWCFDRLYNDFFYHRHNDFWYGKAMWKLPPLIDSTGMLCCAEDLGMIPACVPDVMNRLQMISLEIQRMPKDPNSMFGDPAHYPYLSVCTTSTHDMGGIRVWWEENREATQKFYNNMLHQHGEAPVDAEPWICDLILRQNLAAPSMLCILPLQDWMACDANIRRQDPRDEVINIPANPKHYWRYRMHLTLEQLKADSEFNSHISQMITESGR